MVKNCSSSLVVIVLIPSQQLIRRISIRFQHPSLAYTSSHRKKSLNRISLHPEEDSLVSEYIRQMYPAHLLQRVITVIELKLPENIQVTQ